MKAASTESTKQSTSGRSGSAASRRARASESFGTVAECLGEIGPGSSIFAVTRGQWSMIDAVLYALDRVGPQADISLWTWTVAEYEVQTLTRLMLDYRLRSGLLVIDAAAKDPNVQKSRTANTRIIQDWQEAFGAESVRYVTNHAKIATVEGSGLKFLLRGSMNLNFNPRFEQFDLTEGGEDFDMVRHIESQLPVLPNNCSRGEARDASKLGDAWTEADLLLFSGMKTWTK